MSSPSNRLPLFCRRLAPVAALGAALAVGQATVPTQAPAPGPAPRGLTAVDGLKVGSITLTERPTGCTVVVVDGAGAVGGVSQRGGAPGTRETDLLDPSNMVDKVNAIVLAGGSAYGLEAATGAVRWLAEHHMRRDVRIAQLPINGKVQEGSVGAGAGATVGKSGGGGRSMKAGLGSYAIRMPNGLVVGALVAVNAVGDIIDPDTGKIVAGVRNPDNTFADARQILRRGGPSQTPRPGANTTIGLVATNAKLTKADAHRMALMADDGFARAIFPSHTMGDGDTVFSLGTGTWTGEVNITQIGALAADVMAKAIVRAATEATGLPNLPAARDLAKR